VASLLLGCSGCADMFLLGPSTQPISSPSATPLTIPSANNRVVELWTARSSACGAREPQAFVLRFCGNGERAERAVQVEREMWSDLPVEIWAMNYPGFGGSTGPAQLRLLAPAALATYDALAKRSTGRPVFLSGMSMGTTVALYVAANRRADGLLLRSPVPVRDVILWRYGWWNLWLVAGPVALGFPSELDSEQNAHRVNAPAVFIITGRDELVPRAYQRRISAALAGHKRVVIAENAGHNSPLTEKESEKVQNELRWLWSKRPVPIPHSRPTSASATKPAG
jgi:pimeloyl-ACP methyl ester carboxylesterase